MAEYQVKLTTDQVNPWVILEDDQVIGRYPEKRLAERDKKLWAGEKPEK